MEVEPQLQPTTTEEEEGQLVAEQEEVPEEGQEVVLEEEANPEKQESSEKFQEDIIEAEETPRVLENLDPQEPSADSWNSEHEVPKITSADAIPTEEDEGSNEMKTTLTNDVIKEFFKQHLSLFELTTPEVLEQFVCVTFFPPKF